MPILPLGIDPTGAEQGARAFVEATERVKESARQTEQATDRAAAAGARAASRNRRFFGRFTQAVNDNRIAVQQAGFQLGDFAVQLGAGINPMVAFTQQGSQMLQVFGPLGAIAGAALAIVGGLAGAFFAMGRDAEDASEGVDELDESIKTISESMRELQGVAQPSTEALQATVRIAVAGIALQLRQARDDLEEAIRLRQEMFTLEAGGMAGDVTRTEEIIELEERVRELNLQLTIARAYAGEFGDRFQTSARNAVEALEKLNREQERSNRESEREQELRNRAAQSIDDMVMSLRAEADLLQQTARERAIGRALLRAETTARRAGIEVTAEQAEAIREAAGEVHDMNEAMRDAVAVQQALARTAGESATRVRDHMEVMSHSATEAANAQIEMRRQQQDFVAGARRGFEEYARGAERAGDLGRDAVVGSLMSMEDALVSFVQTGKLEFSSLVDSMIADLIRLFARMAAMQLIGSIFGTGTTGGTGMPAGLGTPTGGGSGGAQLHGGGTFRTPPGSAEYVPLMTLRGNEEVRVTRLDQASAQAPNVSIEIITPPGQPATVERQDGPDEIRIRAMIGEQMAQELKDSPNGPAARAVLNLTGRANAPPFARG